MTTSPEHNDDHGHSEFHVVPIKFLVATGTALLFLTVLTVWAAGVDFAKIDLPEMNIVVALAIATIKASLVGLFFMHLKWDRPFNAFVFVASIAFLGLFIGFALVDTAEYNKSIDQYRQIELQGGETAKIEAKLAENKTE